MTTSLREEPRIRLLHDASRRDLSDPTRPRPVRLYLWEPHRPLAVPAPVVVVSHGTGGSGSTMGWLARPLAAAGFRVVALDHHGNNDVDGYEPEGFTFVWERPRDLSFTLDALAAEEPLGPVGAAGFSLGGYTVAALAGARVDPQIVAALLAGRIPLPALPEFPDIIEALREKVPADELQAMIGVAGADVSDSRVRAVFQVAPAVGSLVTPESLATVRVPVELRWGGADTICPFDEDTRPYLDHIPTAAGRSAGPDVCHEDFFEAEPTGEPTRTHIAQEAATFFRQHLT